MRLGKGLCLFQRFARHDGHFDHRAGAPPVKDQILNGIRRAPFEGCADLCFTRGLVWPRYRHFGVKDLPGRQNQLGSDPMRRQPKRRGAQVSQRLLEVRGVKLDRPNLQPTARGAVQKANGRIGDIQSKIWFHCTGLAQKEKAGVLPL